jgi:DNA polymerase III subunit delta
MFGGDKVGGLRNANFLSDNVIGRSQRTEAMRAALEAGLPDGVRFLMTALGVWVHFAVPLGATSEVLFFSSYP